MKGIVIKLYEGWATVQFSNGSTFDFWLFSRETKVGDTVYVSNPKYL
jgi:hypothetical protein